jgi:hypothetical protein
LLPWLFRERELRKKNPKYEMNLLALEDEEWRINRNSLDAIFSSIPKGIIYIYLYIYLFI